MELELEVELEASLLNCQKQAMVIRKLREENKALVAERNELLDEIHALLTSPTPSATGLPPPKDNNNNNNNSKTEDEAKLYYMERTNKQLRRHVTNLQLQLSSSKTVTGRRQDKSSQTLLAPVNEEEAEHEGFIIPANRCGEVRQRGQGAPVAALVRLAQTPVVVDRPLVVHRSSQTDESLLPP